MSPAVEHYILATGRTDVDRLRILNEVYGPGTETGLRRAGLRPGMRVVEFGCGSGNIACWVAEQVGPSGQVVGIDVSQGQVEQARQQAAARGLTNVQFVASDAYEPDLPAGSFDLAYCRLVLMHLTQPAEALAAMRSLVKPGGTVFCEEMDENVWACNPPRQAMGEFFRLSKLLGERLGENYCLGAELPELFRAAGFDAPEVGANFRLALRGEEKRLMPMTFAEFAPELVSEGLAEQGWVARVLDELRALADDETTLFGFPLNVQVWARR